MGMIDLARNSREIRNSSATTRRKFFTEDVRRELKNQWRYAASKSSRVYLHIFNESEGTEFYVTGWDGADTVAALTNEGFRNVSLHEARGCKVDTTWNDKTPLWAVMEEHSYVSDQPAAVTRTRTDTFDKMFSQYLNVSGMGDAPKKNRKLVGESRKFALQEETVKPKWVVAVDPRGHYKAAQRQRDIPMNYLPVEVVRAMTEEEAIEKGTALQESGSAHFAARAPVHNPYFRQASGLTLDIDKVMESVLEEGKRNDISKEITKSIARTFWASTWADYKEEQGESLGGGEIMDMAPRTPSTALKIAIKFVKDIERANKKSVSDLYQDAISAKGRHTRSKDPDYFGHALAMMSMGHGVSWFDDHPKFPLKVPYTLEHHGSYDFSERDLDK